MNNIKRINRDSGDKVKIEENSNKKIKNEKINNDISNSKEKEKINLQKLKRI